MKKIYNFAFFGNCENEISFCFNKNISVRVYNEKGIKDGFKDIRKILKKDYLNTIKKQQISSYKNFIYSISLTIIDINKNKARVKMFKINPLKLKNLNE